MNLAEIEMRVAMLDTTQGFDLIYDLLLAYGLPRASISRLRSGSYNKSPLPNETLWKGKVFYRFVDSGEDLHVVIDDAKSEERIRRERPRLLIVRDRERLVAVDTRADATLDCLLSNLQAHADFFLPWAGIERTQLENLNYADVKAAERMARLYDEIIRHNSLNTSVDVHRLNVFFARLLFCFFAEDTRVFEKGQFTNAVGSLTTEDGHDVHAFLDELFQVLDTTPSNRASMPSRFRDFGYVDGNLFSVRAPAPQFSAKARSILLECGQLDWSRINPDIFGSMIQAVVHPGQRGGLGMHYTSVENIMRVIRPLFLDELDGAYDSAADNPRRLEGLLDRICRMKAFDPACGSGNFLVIAYKELRKVEHRILQRIAELDPSKAGLFKLSGIKLENFCGIEIDDFAHEIAILSLWLAKHQMNIEFLDLFGVEISLIPLKDTGTVVCGNAARIAWESVCDPGDDEVFVLGNPPYQGGTRQSAEQKADLAIAFQDESVNKYMDYVSIWLYKGAKYALDHGTEVGFVTTNSVCQGNHVAQLWPRVKDLGVEISFAHAPFKWSNSAKGNAGVDCVVIGLAPRGRRKSKPFFGAGRVRQATHINFYLVPGGRDIVVTAEGSSLGGLPPMVFGSMPRDGGGLLLEQAERDAIASDYPASKPLIRRFMGAAELIRGSVRYCLWIADAARDQAESIPPIAARLERVRNMRAASKADSTKKLAANPHRFAQCAHKESTSIIIPRHTSEGREYIPMGFLDQHTIIGDSANAIYGAGPWTFALIESRMHMVWMSAVAGRIKSDYRYSAELVYNTFPVPDLSGDARETLDAHAFAVLAAREQFAERTLAELYDRLDMPEKLRGVHKDLDDCVDRLYQEQPFESDEERLEMLFALYEDLILSRS
ncbi:MAG: DNA methyltransferase [Actinomycetota bacterium]